MYYSISHVLLPALLLLALVVTEGAAVAGDRAAEYVRRGLSRAPNFMNNRYLRVPERWAKIEAVNRALGLAPGTNNPFYAEHHENALDAIRDYDKAIEVDPSYAPAFYFRALALTYVDYNKTALKDYHNALALSPKMTEALWMRAVCYSNLGQHDKAVQDYTSLLSISPQEADKANSELYDFLYPGNGRPCFVPFMAAERPLKSPAACYRNRGTELQAMGKYAEALRDFTAAIRLDPDNGDGYYRRYQLYKRMGNGQLASRDKSMFKSDMFNCVLSNTESVERSASPSGVCQYYLNELRKDPFSEETHYAYARWLFGQGKNEEALTEVTMALKLDPRFGQALDLRARIYKASGQETASREDQNKKRWIGFQNCQREQNIALQQGMRCRNTGDLDSALYHFDRAIRIDDTLGESYVRRAEIFENLSEKYPFVYVLSGCTLWTIRQNDLVFLAKVNRASAHRLQVSCRKIQIPDNITNMTNMAGPRVPSFSYHEGFRPALERKQNATATSTTIQGANK